MRLNRKLHQQGQFVITNMAMRWTHGDDRERRAVLAEINSASPTGRVMLTAEVHDELKRMDQPAALAAFRQQIVEGAMGMVTRQGSEAKSDLQKI